MDLSIVIAHRGNPLGLWATIHSCEIDLRNGRHDFSYEYRIVSNGEEKLDFDLRRTIDFLDKSGHLGSFQHFPEPLTPPAARQRGTVGASGQILHFFDNHCLVDRDYFARAHADFQHYGMDMLHSTTKFYEGEFTHYHYKLKLGSNFWGEASPFAVNTLQPYRIAAGGHGGFAVRRSVWEEVGGYGPENLFTGYGGEEMYFDLKMALLDKTNWLDPKVIHYHYAGQRGYPRHYTDDYYRNMMTCAYVIGGEKWLMRVYQKFVTQPKHATGVSMFELMADARKRGSDHAKHLTQLRKRDLDEQLDYFVRNQIAYN